MSRQLHNRLSDEQVKAILSKYLKGELNASQAEDMLGLSRSQFFEWVKRYKEGSRDFSVGYSRAGHNHKIDDDLEKAMLKELKMEKALIDDPAMPVRWYNYSFILRVAGADPYQRIELRMVPDHTTMLTEIRFWANGKLMDIQKVKTADLRAMRY